MADTKQGIVSTQPQNTVLMSAGGNKNALNRPIGPDGKRDWSYGLFDCFPACRLYCLAAWCPCVVYSKNRQHLRSLQYQGTTLLADNEKNDSQCCIYGGLKITDYSWVMQIRYREETRERYGIRGSALNDCWVYMWCGPCALTQERREFELEERNLQ